jgi:preprotein translocase subunit YajC
MSKMSSLLDAASFLAQTVVPSGSATGQPQGFLQQLLGTPIVPIALMFGGFWFLFIAPQRKKQKEHEKMLAALQSGDEIISTGGIYGVITNVKDDRFVVRIADNAKVELGKSFIATVVKQAGAEKK